MDSSQYTALANRVVSGKLAFKDALKLCHTKEEKKSFLKILRNKKEKNKKTKKAFSVVDVNSGLFNETLDSDLISKSKKKDIGYRRAGAKWETKKRGKGGKLIYTYKDKKKKEDKKEEKKVNRGHLWVGRSWEDAIRLSLSTPDCGIEPVYKYKHPEKLLDTGKKLIGYQIYGYDNRRKYKTRIPKEFNPLVEKLLAKEKEPKDVELVNRKKIQTQLQVYSKAKKKLDDTYKKMAKEEEKRIKEAGLDDSDWNKLSKEDQDRIIEIDMQVDDEFNSSELFDKQAKEADKLFDLYIEDIKNIPDKFFEGKELSKQDLINVMGNKKKRFLIQDIIIDTIKKIYG